MFTYVCSQDTYILLKLLIHKSLMKKEKLYFCHIHILCYPPSVRLPSIWVLSFFLLRSTLYISWEVMWWDTLHFLMCWHPLSGGFRWLSKKKEQVEMLQEKEKVLHNMCIFHIYFYGAQEGNNVILFIFICSLTHMRIFMRTFWSSFFQGFISYFCQPFPCVCAYIMYYFYSRIKNIYIAGADDFFCQHLGWSHLKKLEVEYIFLF